MKGFDFEQLQAGDCLLYGPSTLAGWVIAVKTWTRVSHVEIYSGNRMSVASRDGIGVNRYALRTAGLVSVRRPVNRFAVHKEGLVSVRGRERLNLAAAERWFEGVRGQKYDWLGLCCFELAVKQGASDRQFCSEFATNWYRAAGFEPFNPSLVADLVAPSEFWQAGTLWTVWDANERKG